MMKYFYSESSKGFYVEGIHETMPEDVIELTEDQHAAILEANHNGHAIVVADGVVTTMAPPVEAMDSVRKRLIQSINASAESTYAGYGFGGPGIVAEHAAAAADARAYLVNPGTTAPPSVRAEADATSASNEDAAAAILDAAERDKMIMEEVRSIRLSYAALIRASQTLEEAESIAKEAIEKLRGI